MSDCWVASVSTTTGCPNHDPEVPAVDDAAARNTNPPKEVMAVTTALLARSAEPATRPTARPATTPVTEGAVRRRSAPPTRLRLRFINNHLCDHYELVLGWAECIHHMVIHKRDLPARVAEAKRSAADPNPGGERG
jgi:hypothetical protein